MPLRSFAVVLAILLPCTWAVRDTSTPDIPHEGPLSDSDAPDPHGLEGEFAFINPAGSAPPPSFTVSRDRLCCLVGRMVLLSGSALQECTLADLQRLALLCRDAGRFSSLSAESISFLHSVVDAPTDSLICVPSTSVPVGACPPFGPFSSSLSLADVPPMLQALEGRVSALEDALGTTSSDRSPRRSVLRRLQALERH